MKVQSFLLIHGFTFLSFNDPQSTVFLKGQMGSFRNKQLISFSLGEF